MKERNGRVAERNTDVQGLHEPDHSKIIIIRAIVREYLAMVLESPYNTSSQS